MVKLPQKLFVAESIVKNQIWVLQNWTNSPKGAIRKTDITIAKNYLNEKELDGLNRIVTMYLDYAEILGTKRSRMTHERLGKQIRFFLQFNEEDILQKPVVR